VGGELEYFDVQKFETSLAFPSDKQRRDSLSAQASHQHLEIPFRVNPLALAPPFEVEDGSLGSVPWILGAAGTLRLGVHIDHQMAETPQHTDHSLDRSLEPILVEVLHTRLAVDALALRRAFGRRRTLVRAAEAHEGLEAVCRTRVIQVVARKGLSAWQLQRRSLDSILGRLFFSENQIEGRQGSHLQAGLQIRQGQVSRLQLCAYYFAKAESEN